MNFSVHVDDSLLEHVPSHLDAESDIIVIGHPQGKRSGFINSGDVDLVIAPIAQAQPYELSPPIQIYFEQLLWLFGRVCVFVDGDWEIEVVDKHDSRNNLEIVYGKLRFLLFLLLLLLSLPFISFWLCVGVVVFEVVEFGCLFGDLVDGGLLDDELNSTIFRVSY